MATHSSVLGESQGRGSLAGCRLWGLTEWDATEATQQQLQQARCFCNSLFSGEFSLIFLMLGSLFWAPKVFAVFYCTKDLILQLKKKIYFELSMKKTDIYAILAPNLALGIYIFNKCVECMNKNDNNYHILSVNCMSDTVLFHIY